MKGHLRERSPGHWAIILDLGRDPNGKRKQKWVSFKGGKRAAEKELRRLLTDMDEGTFVAPTKQTTGEFLEQWLKDYA